MSDMAARNFRMAAAMRPPLRVSLSARLLRSPALTLYARPQPSCLLQSRLASGYPSSFLHSERAKGPVEPDHKTYFEPPPPPPQAPKRKSLLLRAVWFLAKYLALTGTIIFGSAYLGYISLPPSTQMVLLSLTQDPITDAESLFLYNPENVPVDDETKRYLHRINNTILSHPLAQKLRASPDFNETRPHMKIPPAARPGNLTAGALAGPQRISVPPLIFNEVDGKSMVALIHLGENLCGHPGIVHGGLLATLLDEGLARCCFPALPNKVGVTAFLNIDYRKPARADRFYVLRAVTEKVEGRKAFVKGWIEELGEGEDWIAGVIGVGSGVSDAEVEARRRRINVQASALFVEPRNAGRMARIAGVE